MFASEENALIWIHMCSFSPTFTVWGGPRFLKVADMKQNGLFNYEPKGEKNDLDTIRSLRVHILLCHWQKWTSDLHHPPWQESKSKRTPPFCKIPAIQFNSFVPWKTQYHLSGIELTISPADLVFLKPSLHRSIVYIMESLGGIWNEESMFILSSQSCNIIIN